jgi:hypothetical protein
MRFVVIAAAALCLCAHGQDKKKKPPDIQVLEVKVQRTGEMVTIDGRLRATGERPISRLVLSFDFLDGSAVLVTKQARVDAETLKTGDEAPFHVETDCPAKAYELRINAYRNGSELTVGNPGPHAIVE